MRSVGQIGDMRLAEERHHVVLAMALDLDVAQHDDVVIARHLVEGARQDLERVLAVAGEILVDRRS